MVQGLHGLLHAVVLRESTVYSSLLVFVLMCARGRDLHAEACMRLATKVNSSLFRLTSGALLGTQQL